MKSAYRARQTSLMELHSFNKYLLHTDHMARTVLALLLARALSPHLLNESEILITGIKDSPPVIKD